MSNARNLANLLGTATTIQTAKIADDAITNAKLNDSGSFTIAGLTVSGASTFQGAATATSRASGRIAGSISAATEEWNVDAALSTVTVS